LEKFKGKVKFFRGHNLLCKNLQLSVGKLQLFVPPTLMTKHGYFISEDSSLIYMYYVIIHANKRRIF